MRKLYLALLFFFTSFSFLYSQTPYGISYQAIVRDGNALWTNSFVKATFQILQSDTLKFEEFHNVTTNDYGLFTVIIGEGTSVQGSLSALDWSHGNYDLQVFFSIGGNSMDMGSSRLVSVPYSLFADKARTVDSLSITDLIDVDPNAANAGQILQWNGSNWEATDPTIYQAGQGISINGSSIQNTGDIDASDDITNVTAATGDLSGTYPSPEVSGLGGMDLAPFLNTAANGQVLKWDSMNQHWEPANDNGEIYTAGTGISIQGNNIANTLPDQPVSILGTGAISVTGTYPNFALFSTTNFDDADANPANELQNLSFFGDSLGISNGNKVHIPPPIVYTEGNGIDINGTTISNSDPDQTVSLIGNGSTAITGNYPNFTISSTDNVEDADANPTNELQNLSFVGDSLGISNGNKVHIPPPIAYTEGNGIDINGTTISNSDPDQTVSLIGNGSTVITGTYPNFTISSTDNVEDADANPTNELQMLSLVGDSLEISNGNKVALPAGINYTGGTAITVNAGVISNDLPDKVVSLTPGGATSITGTYPNFTISSTDLVEDADANPTNELQMLSLVGDSLEISNGNKVALPAGINYTGGTAITVNAGVISNDLPDKVVSLTPGGATTITGTYPDFTISSTDLVEDADADPSNELQTLSLVGDSLEISNGNKVALPAGINYTGGTAITVNAGVISNDLPDKVVSLTPGGATTITGTYPDFTISSTDNVNDADANPTNEIQALSLNGSLLGITGQPDVNLSGIYSAGSGITLVNSVIENSAQDKIVSLTGSGATSVTGTYPNFTISSTDNVNDSDASASNELISAVDFSGQTLTITEAGIVHSTVISGVGGGGNIIEDSDQDTKIQVEESNDEDIIRFDVEGTEVLVLDRRSAGQTLLNPNPNTNDIYMGRGSGLNSDPDGYNTALGDSALWKNGLGGSSADHGTNNTAVGALAMKQNSTGHDNVAFGSQALQSNQGGVNLTAIGHQALSSNINGHSDVAVGEKALLNNTTGVNNTAIGTLALQSNTTASNNTAVGRSAMENNTTGAHNIAIGRSALGSNTTAFANVAVGTRALFSNKSISKLVAVGDSALYNNGQTVSGSTEGTHNTAVGSKALFENRKGYYNTAVGFEALTVNDNGFHNSAFGRYALFKNTSAQENTAIGSAALFDNTVGDGNTAVGRSTLSNNIGGDNNTAIGFSAFNANGATSYSNSTAIGYNAEPTGSNQVRIGNSTVGSIGGYAAWTNLSDGRFKQHIREDVRGLAFILDLRPVSYQLNMDKLAQALGEELDDEAQENSRQQKASTRQTGFIAQEVEKTAQELGFEFSGIDTPDTPQDHYGLRYAEFVVPLVKAIQEQQQMIEDQQAVNRVQTQQIQSLQLRLEQLEAMISTQD